ncbi:MAG: hypothetical protein M3044_00705 [Thermoproteota archaeon]|nr:hypothetical protein [Thermoproteota archaeon]
MNKLTFAFGAIIVITTIFVIPSVYPTHIIKASQCSVSIGLRGTLYFSGTSSGSCSSRISTGQHFGILVPPHGGSKSSCSGAGSTGPTSTRGDADGSDSNGAVNCSVHVGP